MRRAIRAEWAKACSTLPCPGCCSPPSCSAWQSAATIGTAGCQATACGQDPARISLAGVYLGQAVAAVLGVLALGGEYATGMIHVTLTAIPRRRRILAAKAAVLACLVLSAPRSPCVPLLARRLVLPGHGFTAGPRLPTWPWATAASLARCASVLYLMLVARLGLGVTTVSCGTPRRDRVRARVALPVPGPPAVAAGNQAAVRRLEQIGADDRRAGHPGNHRPEQPADRPVGGPRRVPPGPPRAAGRCPRCSGCATREKGLSGIC